MTAHQQRHADPARWDALGAGDQVTVIKHTPEGEEAARYEATVVGWSADRVWLGVRATWTFRRYELDGLVFAPGDELIEWFSPHEPYNAFGVIAPGGALRGWYANVTYPAYLRRATTEDRLELVWHDLYLDLVGLPDGSYIIRDEDELADAHVAESSPLLHEEILAAATKMTDRFRLGAMPFQLPPGAVAGVIAPPEVLQ
ncbi:MAG: DUF402 domain-containing protein [Thermomicrobiales bacterium]